MDQLYPIIRRKRRPLIDVDASVVPVTNPVPQPAAVSEPAPPGAVEVSSATGPDVALPEKGGDIGSPEGPSPVPGVSAPAISMAAKENENNRSNSVEAENPRRPVRGQPASRN